MLTVAVWVTILISCFTFLECVFSGCEIIQTSCSIILILQCFVPCVKRWNLCAFSQFKSMQARVNEWLTGLLRSNQSTITNSSLPILFTQLIPKRSSSSHHLLSCPTSENQIVGLILVCANEWDIRRRVDISDSYVKKWLNRIVQFCVLLIGSKRALLHHDGSHKLLHARTER